MDAFSYEVGCVLAGEGSMDFPINYDSCDSSMLPREVTKTLRGKDYFGQYGPIEKVVVSKPKSGALNQGVGVYVTFKNKEDAATCINCVDGSPNGDKILR